MASDELMNQSLDDGTVCGKMGQLFMYSTHLHDTGQFKEETPSHVEDSKEDKCRGTGSIGKELFAVRIINKLVQL
uniref:Pept_C1 domain-containing protein n=1 Tax=Heterorhabditis bacteriophora TaxID=37862 RepID=A0A1I7X3T2_HETBA